MQRVIVKEDAKPLRSMFLDLNAYFASVEQAEHPELRGKPVAVCPVMADSSFVIAASYEAKACGVKTGTKIGDARGLCPDIVLVPATPALYVHYHQKILHAAESVLPVAKVCSIDEMAFDLIGKEREPDEAARIGVRMKEAILDQVSSEMTCSLGIAPNRFLAKLATDLQKPNGFVMIQGHELPARLRGIPLREFCGINRRMEIRLQAAGIFTSDNMIDAGPDQLARAFGSVTGERWYYLLRGYDLKTEETKRKSLSHSHVLPPELRTEEGTRKVLLRLTQKAAARLRAEGLWTSDVTVYVQGIKQSWSARQRCAPTQDSTTINEVILKLWEKHDFRSPLSVGLTFHNLSEAAAVTPSLFDQTVQRAELSHALDDLNQKFGKNTIYLASLEQVKNAASEKIAFDKTWLFSEGKGDNSWDALEPGSNRPPIFGRL